MSKLLKIFNFVSHNLGILTTVTNLSVKKRVYILNILPFPAYYTEDANQSHKNKNHSKGSGLLKWALIAHLHHSF